MNKPALTTTLRSAVVLFVVVPACQFLNGQTPDAGAQTNTEKTTDVLKTIDRLIEQNRKLEQQNRDLMQQINSLRRSIANEAGPAGDTAPAQRPPSPAPPDTSVVAPTSGANQSSSQSSNDDKTLLPEASGGNPAVFGEFNPGRGFTVGRGEYGELNLSGYMAGTVSKPVATRSVSQGPLGTPNPG